MIAACLRFMTLAVLVAAVNAAWAADLEAWLDRNRVAEGDTVQLTLEARGQTNGRPDTAPLEQDFDVLGMSTGSRVSIVNGRTDARTTWTLTLSPKHSGVLTIPALQVAGSQSRALTLTVSDAPAPVPDSGADILIETELSPRRPYVQGQVLYTLRLLHAVPVSGGQLSEPAPKNALVQRLGEDREYSVTRQGRRYQVIERRYALFPQASGRLELAAPVFDGEIPDPGRRRTSPFKRFFGNDPFFGTDPFDDLMTPTRRVRVRGEPAELDVRPRAAAARGNQWLPAEILVLNGDWQPDADTIRQGEPVTLMLDLEAQGLTGGQLPNLAPDVVDGFDVYPDQPQRKTETSDSFVTGSLNQKIAFIPRRAGELTLPAITVHWWDTQADRERTATLPGRVLQVQPLPGQSSPPATARPSSRPAIETGPDQSVPDVSTPVAPKIAAQPARIPAPGLWPWVSAALALGWLLTLVFWWRHGRGVRTTVREAPATDTGSAEAGAARKQFLAACHAGEAISARRALLAWAAAHWRNDPPRGLEDLARRLPDPETRAALAELDHALYHSAGGAWNGTRLANLMRRLPKREANVDQRKAVLAPLYPDSASRAQRGY